MIVGNVRIDFEPRLKSPRWLMFAVPLLSLVFALVVAAIFLLATGHSPLTAYGRMLDKGFLSFYGITDTLGLATPLICTGLAAAFAFRMNLFNIGEEGQLYLGMIGGAWAGIVLVDSLPTVIAVPIVLAVGAGAGAMWVLVPALLRSKFGTSEIVSTLLLNYVALNLVNFFIFGSRTVLRDPSPFPDGQAVAESARLDRFGTTNTYPTLIIAIVLAILLWLFIRYSNYGYETSVFADSPNTARYAGMSAGWLTLSVLLGSGALAGLGGAMYIVGPAGKVDPGLLQLGLGYAGIVVAALARYNFLAVVLTAVLFAGLRVGGAALQISSDPIPISIAVVIQGAVLLFALGGEMFRRSVAHSSGGANQGGGSGVNANVWVLTFADAIAIATTLILASIGAMLTERSGVINLGVEGYLLMGAVSSFLIGMSTNNVWLALFLPILVGVAMALVHAVLTISLRANQIVSGLAMVIFGTGLSSFLGKSAEGNRRPVTITDLDFGALSDIPFFGPVIFGHDPITYVTWLIAIIASLYLNRTRPGLVLRATGDAPATVDAQGVSVAAVRYAHTLVGGAFMGFAGSWFMLARGTAWSQGATTAGIGWIALALVVFAAWRPLRAVGGAVLFGFTLQVPFTLQAQQINVLAPEIVKMLPYVVTLVVLVALSTPRARKVLGAPKMLGIPFVRDER